MKLPNLDTSQFVTPSVLMKEIERAEKADLINSINEIKLQIESEKSQREKEQSANKKWQIAGITISLLTLIATVLLGALTLLR